MTHRPDYAAQVDARRVEQVADLSIRQLGEERGEESPPLFTDERIVKGAGK